MATGLHWQWHWQWRSKRSVAVVQTCIGCRFVRVHSAVVRQCTALVYAVARCHSAETTCTPMARRIDDDCNIRYCSCNTRYCSGNIRYSSALRSRALTRVQLMERVKTHAAGNCAFLVYTCGTTGNRTAASHGQPSLASSALLRVPSLHCSECVRLAVGQAQRARVNRDLCLW